MMEPTKKLGEILIEANIITQAQLNEALETQKDNNKFLGEILIDHEWVTEVQIMEALSHQFNLKFVRLDPTVLDWEATKGFPYTLLQKHECFPIKQDISVLRVAISDPLDAWTLSALENEARGRHLELVLATQQDIRAAVQELTRRTLE